MKTWRVFEKEDATWEYFVEAETAYEAEQMVRRHEGGEAEKFGSETEILYGETEEVKGDSR